MEQQLQVQQEQLQVEEVVVVQLLQEQLQLEPQLVWRHLVQVGS